MTNQVFYPHHPLQASSPSWSGTYIATPQEREGVALMAAKFGMYAPQMRQFPPETLNVNPYSPYMQQHLNHIGSIYPTWEDVGRGMDRLHIESLNGYDRFTPQGTTAVLAGCTEKTTVGLGCGPIPECGACTMGSFSNMLESPSEQIREAIEYTLQQAKGSLDAQEWAVKTNQLQAKMNAFVQEHAWAFINPERGRPWQAPTSKAAAQVWADFIDLVSGDEMLSRMLTLFPQIAALRDSWRQEDATFAPRQPTSALSALLGVGAVAGLGWLAWSLLRRPPQAVQPIQGE